MGGCIRTLLVHITLIVLMASAIRPQANGNPDVPVQGDEHQDQDVVTAIGVTAIPAVASEVLVNVEPTVTTPPLYDSDHHEEYVPETTPRSYDCTSMTKQALSGARDMIMLAERMLFTLRNRDFFNEETVTEYRKIVGDQMYYRLPNVHSLNLGRKICGTQGVGNSRRTMMHLMEPTGNGGWMDVMEAFYGPIDESDDWPMFWIDIVQTKRGPPRYRDSRTFLPSAWLPDGRPTTYQSVNDSLCYTFDAFKSRIYNQSEEDARISEAECTQPQTTFCQRLMPRNLAKDMALRDQYVVDLEALQGLKPRFDIQIPEELGTNSGICADAERTSALHFLEPYRALQKQMNLNLDDRNYRLIFGLTPAYLTDLREVADLLDASKNIKWWKDDTSRDVCFCNKLPATTKLEVSNKGLMGVVRTLKTFVKGVQDGEDNYQYGYLIDIALAGITGASTLIALTALCLNTVRRRGNPYSQTALSDPSEASVSAVQTDDVESVTETPEAPRKWCVCCCPCDTKKTDQEEEEMEIPSAPIRSNAASSHMDKTRPSTMTGSSVKTKAKSQHQRAMKVSFRATEAVEIRDMLGRNLRDITGIADSTSSSASSVACKGLVYEDSPKAIVVPKKPRHSHHQ